MKKRLITLISTEGLTKDKVPALAKQIFDEIQKSKRPQPDDERTEDNLLKTLAERKKKRG